MKLLYLFEKVSEVCEFFLMNFHDFIKNKDENIENHLGIESELFFQYVLKNRMDIEYFLTASGKLRQMYNSERMPHISYRLTNLTFNFYLIFILISIY